MYNFSKKMKFIICYYSLTYYIAMCIALPLHTNVKPWSVTSILEYPIS